MDCKGVAAMDGYATAVKATPDGIGWDEEGLRKKQLFPPSINKVVDALLSDENWNRAIAGLNEGECLKDVADIFAETTQLDVEYDRDLLQYAYLLKYMPFYALEYEMMYGDIIGLIPDTQLLDEGLSVCSIGPGNLVDYWSLTMAFSDWAKAQKDKGRVNGLANLLAKLSYLGIDIAEWSYPFKFLSIHEKKGRCEALYNTDATSETAAKKITAMDPLVYFFPKSFNEFDPASGIIERIASIISASKRDRLYVAFSFPACQDDEGCFINPSSYGMMGMLWDRLAEAGLRCEGEPVIEHEINTQLDRKTFSESALNHGTPQGAWIEAIKGKSRGFCSGCELPSRNENPCDIENLPAINPMANVRRLNWQVYECDRSGGC